MFGLNIDKETGRILSATYSKYATKGMIIVDTLPEGNITDYIYSDGKYIYDPLPKIVPESPVSEIEQLRADIDYIAIMTGVDL